MISDVLNTAVTEIDRYLKDETFFAVYRGGLREEIVAVQTIMNSLRIKLDSLPSLLSDEVQAFVTAKCKLVPEAEVTAKEVYDCYRIFCKESGFSSATMKCFAVQMRKILPGLKQAVLSGRVVWTGITV